MTATRVPLPSATIGTASRRLDLGGRVVICMFTVVPLSAITVVTFRVASFSLTSIVGASAGLVSWTLASLYRDIPVSVRRVTFAFALLGVALTGSAMRGGITRQGVQFVQVLIAALGALILAAAARRSLGDRLDATIARCLRLSFVIFIGAAVASEMGVGINASPRTSAIVALLGVGWFLAEHRAGKRHALRWALLMLVSIALSLSRTALAAAFLLTAATLVTGSSRHRARNIALVLTLFAAGYSAITWWAPLHDRFVKGDVSLSVAGLNVNAEGRTKVWGVLWSEVPDDAWLGHGPGAASARSVELDPAFDQPHNDYLRLVYDFGAVGCSLLIWCFARSARHLLRSQRGAMLTVPARAALTAGLAILIIMVTDNPLDYPFVMIPLGALVGVGLGSAAQTRG